MKVQNIQKNKTFKGSVLFTVLSVLVVVLLLMITTIGLASAASRRAYKEYYDVQVNATGRSVVDSVLHSISPKGNNAELGAEIYQKTMEKNGTPYTVYVSNNGDLGEGLGTVEKIDFAYVGHDADINDTTLDPTISKRYYIKGSKYPIIKVTATIRMGNEITTYSEYVSDMVINPGSGGDGGLIGTNAISATGTGMNVLGPVGGGLNNGKATGNILSIGNAGVYTGVQFFNSSININTHKVFLYSENVPVSQYSDKAVSNYNGVFVLGDMFFQNNADFLSDYTGNVSKRTPYIFVSGDVFFPNGMQIGACSETAVGGVVGGDVALDASDVSQRIGNIINLYCGAVKTKAYTIDSSDPSSVKVTEGGDSSSFVKVTGDIYCYDEQDTSVLVGKDSSPLTDWITELRKGHDNVSEIKGSVKTKGSLNYGNPTSQMHINGDLVVERILDIRGEKVTVDGNVSAHILKIPYVFVSSDDIKNKLKCATLEYDYVIDKEDKCYDKAGTEIASYDLTNLLSQPISLTGKFPADKELDQVLGITFDTPTTSGKSQLEQINKQEYSLTSGALSNKIIQVPKEMNSRFYVVDTTATPPTKALKGSVPSSGAISTNIYRYGGNTGGVPNVYRSAYKKFDGDLLYAETNEQEFNANVESVTEYTYKSKKKKISESREVDAVKRDGYNADTFRYYKYVGTTAEYSANDVSLNGSNELEINSSCVLKGYYEKITIRVKPSENPATPLWIELDDFHLFEGKIIVEDIVKDGTGNFKKKDGKYVKAAPVYFYITDDSSVKIEKSSLITEFYDKEYFDGNRALKKELVIPSANIPEEFKPGIYIYGSNKEDGTMHEKLSISNNGIVTAYIIAPRATLDVYNAGNRGKTVNYNGKNYQGLVVGIIGSAIVGEVTNAQNDVTLVYVNNSGGEEKDGTEMFGFSSIPGYSSY